MEKSFCSFCYTPLARPLRCAQCHKRGYCSKDCQVRDWKEASHKQWCGKSGEIGFDFAIQDFGEKGLGMVALRDFQKNDLIMVERPILKLPSYEFTLMMAPPQISQIESSAQSAALALAPEDSDFVTKVKTNCMGCTSPESSSTSQAGLFLTMSRVNHSCIGNAEHLYLESRGVKILVACRSIASGEEVTISYFNFQTDEIGGRRQSLLRKYRFTCHCRVCTDPEVEADLEKMKNLDEAILRLGGLGQIEVALKKGQALLNRYDKHGMSSWCYHRTFYDMFQVAIIKRHTLAVGKKYIRRAYESALAFAHDESLESVAKMKRLLEAPSSHRNYRLLD
jgi:SET domain/MYND finger